MRRRINLKFIFQPIKAFLLSPFRYSLMFLRLRNLFLPNRVEEFTRDIMAYINMCKLEGDYCEFGTFEGKSLITAYHFARNYDLPMNFYIFDSFQGLPKVDEDTKEISIYEKGRFTCSFEKWKDNLYKNKVNMDKVFPVRGWYEETLNEETKRSLSIKKISIIWMDCDLYESAILALDFITSYLQKGTIIYFSNWYLYKANPEKGGQKAFNEWLKKTKIKVTDFQNVSWHGKSFIVV